MDWVQSTDVDDLSRLRRGKDDISLITVKSKSRRKTGIIETS